MYFDADALIFPYAILISSPDTKFDVRLKVTFGVLFNDDKCANIFEALVGTLRAAKKRKILTYDGELLLQGVHDNVEIILKPTPTTATETVAADAVVKS